MVTVTSELGSGVQISKLARYHRANSIPILNPSSDANKPAVPGHF